MAEEEKVPIKEMSDKERIDLLTDKLIELTIETRYLKEMCGMKDSEITLLGNLLTDIIDNLGKRK